MNGTEKIIGSKTSINIDNITPYLLEKGLIDIDSIIDGDLKIIDSSRKNRNIKILRNKGTSYILKQPHINQTISILDFEKESQLYNIIEKQFVQVKGTMPRLIYFDSKEHIQVIEYITNGQTLSEYLYGMSEKELEDSFLKTIFGRLGKTMASYHSSFEGQINNNSLLFLSKRVIPPPFFLSRPSPQMFSTLSTANLQLLKVIQQYPELYEFLESLIEEWRIQTLTHGDLKWDNVIMSFDKDNKHLFDIKIIDWETADLGDPAWDIAGIFQDFIKFWLFSLPMTGKETSLNLVSSSKVLLSCMQGSMRSFWHEYATSINNETEITNELLRRSTRYCAARLIQSAYELLQSSSRMVNTAVYMIQISANIFQSIDNAILYLYGIPIGRSY
jgi:thiamine kinase-like enzyme